MGLHTERLHTERLQTERLQTEILPAQRLPAQKPPALKLSSRLAALLGIALQWVKLGVLALAGDWQRARDRALADLQEASRDVGVMEWFWLGVLVLLAMGAWYMMLYAAGQQQGLW
jgi:hypothetical protein